MNKLTLSANRRLLALLVCILTMAAVSWTVNARSRAAAANSPQHQPADILAAGDIDLTFNPTIERPGAGVFDVVLQPNGKSVIGGAFTTVSGLSRPRVARLNSDGSVDTDF